MGGVREKSPNNNEFISIQLIVIILYNVISPPVIWFTYKYSGTIIILSFNVRAFIWQVLQT